MDIIKNKSDENITAAQLLIDNNMYASSVHCTYYACFQLMKHVLHSKLNCSYKTQEQFSCKKGGHDEMIHKFKSQVEKMKENRRVASNVTNLMFKLKSMRVKADYTNSKIDEAFTTEVIKIGEDVNQILNNI